MQTKAFAQPSNFFTLFVLSLTLETGSTAQVEDGHGKGTSSGQMWLAQEHVISRWEDISVMQIDNQLFIQSEKEERTHLYTDKKQHCPPRATLLNRTRVFIEGCTRTFVADLSGAVQYRFHRFWFYDIAPNSMGTRFAVFERGRSAWHELGQGSYDKLRLLVYSTEDGKKLFERKWCMEQRSLSPTTVQRYTCIRIKPQRPPSRP
jgi:hypothetical protein